MLPSPLKLLSTSLVALVYSYVRKMMSYLVKPLDFEVTPWSDVISFALGFIIVVMYHLHLCCLDRKCKDSGV